MTKKLKIKENIILKETTKIVNGGKRKIGGYQKLQVSLKM